MAIPDDVPKPLPAPQPRNIADGVAIVDPISRRGYGPGLIVLVDDGSSGLSIHQGVPSPFQKWGEEGYCVVEISRRAWSGQKDLLRLAVNELSRSERCEKENGIGLVSYDAESWTAAAPYISDVHRIVSAVIYVDASHFDSVCAISTPMLVHATGKWSKELPRSPLRKEYHYPAQSSHAFATPASKGFDYAAEAVTHTRNLTFLKEHMKGPYFDLETIWDEHTYYEFESRSVENTMATMVQEPYVNHIPTLTGGIGREELTSFYRDHFIFSNPKDTELELISRTIGVDRVVDEFIFKFTHNQVIDWLLPGVPPTDRYAEIPFMAVVNIRGDRLYHEHITWDQATALRQVGHLPDYLPLAGGGDGDAKKMLQLPVAGTQTASKLRDKNAVKSNGMFQYGVRTV